MNLRSLFLAELLCIVLLGLLQAQTDQPRSLEKITDLEIQGGAKQEPTEVIDETDSDKLTNGADNEVSLSFAKSRQSCEPVRGIGVNFIGGWAHNNFPTPLPMEQDEEAGLAIQRNWNSLGGAHGKNIPLKDAQGQLTGAVASYQAYNTFRISVDESPGNGRMMLGYLDTNNESSVIVEVSGVPYEDYYVLVYHDGDNQMRNRTGRYSVTARGGLTRSVEVIDSGNSLYPTGYLEHRSRHSVFGILRGKESFKLEAKGVSGDDNVLRAQVNAIQIIDMTHRLNLADIVGGGNGRGSGSAQGLSADTGTKGMTPSVRANHQSSFPELVPVPTNKLIDGVFTPRKSNDNGQLLDTAGHHFSFDEESSNDGPNLSIFNGSAGVGDPGHTSNAGIVFDDVISLGAQHGITFNLEEIRRTNGLKHLAAFTAIFGENSNTAGGSVTGFVFIDGKLVRKVATCGDTEQFLHVKIGANDRFLTLATTDGGDGTKGDLAYFANAYLLYEPVGPSAFSKIFNLKNILIVLAISSLFVTAAFVIIRIRYQRRLRIIRQEQILEEERRRIARDMHDEAGAMLTRISVLSQLVDEEHDNATPQTELLQTISKASREAVRRFDQIVWAVNPRNDTLEQFTAYFADYTTKYFEGTGVDCQLSLPHEIPNLPLSARIRQNLLRAAEEAMSNALKHADAETIRVILSFEDSHLLIRVIDNGNGFNEILDQPGADGLRSMRKRMDTIGGQCDIESMPKAGTAVTLSIHLPLETKRHE